MQNFIWLIAAALLALGLPAVSVAQYDAPKNVGVVASSTYDKSKNETTIEAKRLEVGGTSDQFFILNASVTFSGEKLLKRPDEVIFIIQIGSPSYRYPDKVNVKLRVDGVTRSDLTMLTLDRRPADKQFLETIGARIPYETFKAIALAKEVELTVDKTNMRVGATHLAVLADMNKMINP